MASAHKKNPFPGVFFMGVCSSVDVNYEFTVFKFFKLIVT
jgi:hypothetical protein